MLWIALVLLTPASSRPYVDGSTALWAAYLTHRYATFLPWLAPLVLGLGLAAVRGDLGCANSGNSCPLPIRRTNRFMPPRVPAK